MASQLLMSNSIKKKESHKVMNFLKLHANLSQWQKDSDQPPKN